MLFILTGDVQSGKTRWLERLVAELAADGVESRGVLAPGVWRPRADGDDGGLRPPGSGEGAYEKLGIDNVLLPQGERLRFARRRDLAERDGQLNPASQSAAAASLGIRQSPRGERVTLPTLGPSGRQLRLNCWAKNRQ